LLAAELGIENIGRSEVAVTYRSLAEIFEALDQTRQTIYKRVEHLSPEQYSYKEESGRWSVAGIIEHLSGTEGRILARLQDLIGQGESAGTLAPAREDFRPISVEEIRARTTATRFQAPPALEPRGELTLDELLEKIRSSRNQLLAIRPKFEALDLTEVKFPHPAFGQLDAYQWLALIVMHESRHLDQIDRILSCPGFQSKARADRPGVSS
jgi:uncharacterized damage-inducible protein DinB